MVSLSYGATLKVIDRLTTDHDSVVADWRNSLLHHLLVTICAYFPNLHFKYYRSLKMMTAMILEMRLVQQ